jgi:DNA (cytosine-5)-methyltransferase 1
MRYLSVCAGIEAASVAWHPLGWEPAAFSEIEAFPRAVLAHRFPDVPIHGDFTTIGADDYGPIDLLVGGTPCQSFSIAGLRGGLDDDRGNLALEFLRLAQRKRPRWLVWENVPGVLSSSGGRDFGAILGGMVECGYGFAYRVLDAQFAGVPQRRRRVFVVGYLGDWRRAAAVLFERHGLQGHPAPCREARKIAPTIPSRSSGGGGLGTDFDCGGGLIEAYGGGNTSGPLPVAAALTAHGRRQDFEVETFITHSLRGEGFDASEDGTGRGTPLVPVHVAQTMQAGGNTTGGDRPYGTTVDTCESLVPIAFDTTQITSAANYSNPKPGDPCHPLAAGAHPPAIAFDCKGTEVQFCDDGTHPTLRSMGHKDSHTNGGGHAAVAYAIQERAVSENPDAGPDGAGWRDDGAAYTLEARTVPQAVAFALRGREGGAQVEIEGDVTGALRASNGGSSRSYVAASAVRRLTPVECSRLQGFPDDYLELVYADADEAHAAQILHILWREAGAQKITSKTEGITKDGSRQLREEHGISIPLLTPEILLAGVHVGWLSWSMAEQCAAARGALPGENHDAKALVRSLRQASESRYTPYRRESFEQCARELGRTLSELPLESSQARAALLSHPLWPQAQAQWPLRYAFATPEKRHALNKLNPDGPRYKALGNSMAVPVMRWIGERIQMVERLGS